MQIARMHSISGDVLNRRADLRQYRASMLKFVEFALGFAHSAKESDQCENCENMTCASLLH